MPARTESNGLSSHFWLMVITSQLEYGPPKWFGRAPGGEVCVNCGTSDMWKAYQRSTRISCDCWHCGHCGYPHPNLASENYPVRPLLNSYPLIAQQIAVARKRRGSLMVPPYATDLGITPTDPESRFALHRATAAGWLDVSVDHDRMILRYAARVDCNIPIPDDILNLAPGDIFFVRMADFSGPEQIFLPETRIKEWPSHHR